MARIARLSSTVADQIAAGEVVERPASAVKELVENALDAGAATIEIDIEDGGRALIRVSDDGSGMDREDAVLALDRHATSKIRSLADLVGVASFGFRGEALPAICSVSRFDLTTATADGTGTQVVAAGGVVERVAAAARRRGTTVTVAQLFYNTPARRKFLRSARSEWRAIADTLILMALVRRDVRLTVRHDGKSALALSPAATLRERVAGVWGADTAARFLDVDGLSGAIRVQGMVERPADVGLGARRVALIINGRVVRDGGIVRAAEAAFRNTLAPGQRPSLVLELTVPSDSLDVNVHPAKAEVRFHDRWGVERAVEHAVRRVLGTLDAMASLGGPAANVLSWSPRGQAPGGLATLPAPPAATSGPLFGVASPPDDVAGAARGIGAEASPVPPLFQLRHSFMAFEAEDGLVLIDQHSAHERVLFERFSTQFAQGGAPSQRLLFPETVHLSPEEGDAWEAVGSDLSRLGFEIEPFGGHALLVHAVPAPHPRFDALRCLRESLAAVAGDRVASANTRHEHLLATVACKAAVKAGDPLSSAEMTALYRALQSTGLPAHDVHGRSSIVQLTWDELERRFGRR